MNGLSREDRARLEVLGQYVDCEVALRALALIDQQEKALEAADELARVAGMESVYMAPNGNGAEAVRRITKAEAAYRSARSTSTKEDG